MLVISSLQDAAVISVTVPGAMSGTIFSSRLPCKHHFFFSLVFGRDRDLQLDLVKASMILFSSKGKFCELILCSCFFLNICVLRLLLMLYLTLSFVSCDRKDKEWGHKEGSEMMFNYLVDDYTIPILIKDQQFIKTLIARTLSRKFYFSVHIFLKLLFLR
jgi:hypothetical protein